MRLLDGGGVLINTAQAERRCARSGEASEVVVARADGHRGGELQFLGVGAQDLPAPQPEAEQADRPLDLPVCPEVGDACAHVGLDSRRGHAAQPGLAHAVYGQCLHSGAHAVLMQCSCSAHACAHAVPGRPRCRAARCTAARRAAGRAAGRRSRKRWQAWRGMRGGVWAQVHGAGG